MPHRLTSVEAERRLANHGTHRLFDSLVSVPERGMASAGLHEKRLGPHLGFGPLIRSSYPVKFVEKPAIIDSGNRDRPIALGDTAHANGS